MTSPTTTSGVHFRSHTLPNGLTIIGEIVPDAHSASAGFFVKTGARDERPVEMGVSHYLEHMMFKGTERRSADDVNREFDEMGAEYNAFTSSEMTAFFATTLPEMTERSVDLLADILRPSLRQADFDMEKGVILEEIAMYKDVPFWVLYERAMEEYYGDHTLSFRVLGTNDTITNLERDTMQRYFDARYSADNTALCLAGAIDFDKVCAQAEKVCGHWQRTGASRDNATPTVNPKEFEIRDPNVNRAYLLMLSPGPAVQDEDKYAAAMLAQVLGAPGNSRLHWALVENGLAEEAQAAYDPRDGCGDFFVYGSCDPDKVDAVWKAMNSEIESLVGSLTEDDLEKLRNKAMTSATLAGERPSGRMQRLGRVWTYLGEYVSLEDELAKMNAVTLDDMRRVFERFPFQPRTVGRMLPA